MFGKRRSTKSDNQFEDEAEIGEDLASGTEAPDSSFESAAWSDDQADDEERDLMQGRQSPSQLGQSLPWLAGGAIGIALLGYVGYNQFIAPPVVTAEQGELPQIASDPTAVVADDATAMASPTPTVPEPDQLQIVAEPEAPAIESGVVEPAPVEAAVAETTAPTSLLTGAEVSEAAAVPEVESATAPEPSATNEATDSVLAAPVLADTTQPLPVAQPATDAVVVARIDELDARLSSLSKSVAETAAPTAPDLAPVVQKIESLEASYSTLTAKLDELTAAVAAPPPAPTIDLAPIEEKISALTKSYEDLSAKVEAVPAATPAVDLAPIEAKIAGIEETYTALSGKIETLSTTPVTANAAPGPDLSPLQAEISALQASFKSLEVQVADVSKSSAERPAPSAAPDLSPIEARLASLEAGLSDVKAVSSVSATSATVSAAETADIAPLSAEIAELKEAYTALNAKIEGFESKPVTAQASVTPPAVDLKPLQRQIQSLQAKVDAISKSAAPAASAATMAAKPSQAAPTQQPLNSWVLRAAQDNEAWISPTATGELRRVVTGDSVAGIGKVKAIRLTNNQWEVVGTSGTIRQ